MDGWMDGWMGGKAGVTESMGNEWMGGIKLNYNGAIFKCGQIFKAGLRIAYSNQKPW